MNRREYKAKNNQYTPKYKVGDKIWLNVDKWVRGFHIEAKPFLFIGPCSVVVVDDMVYHKNATEYCLKFPIDINIGVSFFRAHETIYFSSIFVDEHSELIELEQ